MLRLALGCCQLRPVARDAGDQIIRIELVWDVAGVPFHHLSFVLLLESETHTFTPISNEKVQRPPEALQSPLFLVTQLGRDSIARLRAMGWLKVNASFLGKKSELLAQKLIYGCHSAGLGNEKRRFAEIFLQDLQTSVFFGNELWNDSFNGCCPERDGWALYSNYKNLRTKGSYHRTIHIFSKAVRVAVRHAKSAVVLTPRPGLSAARIRNCPLYLFLCFASRVYLTVAGKLEP